jgi:outer membrane protein insertion porin family
MQANGKSFQSYSISFTEPWLGGKRPNSLTVSLNKSISRLANNYFSYTPTFSDDRMLRQSGITIGIGRRLTWPDNYFTLSNSISVLGYNYKNYPGLPAKGTTMNLNLNTTLSRNSIDNPMFPTSGSSLSLSLTLTPPYSLLSENNYLQNEATKFKFVELHKWMIDTKFYLKLIGSKKLEGGRSLVLETKAHFGIIGSYAKGNTPGPFERFLLGGDGLAGGFQSYVLGQDIIGLRGYDNNRVTPPNYASNQSTGNQIQGGIVYNKLGLELRYPVTTSESATIYGFLFTEGGNNWGNFAEFNPFKIYKSAGAGVRLFMPAFGLIGLNWGYGFDTLPGAAQRSGAHFHFTIGQQIR